MTDTRAHLLTLATSLLLLVGCQHDITQVALVVQSDLMVPSEVDGMDVAAIEGPFSPPVNPFFSGPGGTPQPFPLSVGFESGGRTVSFSTTVRLFTGVTTFFSPTLVISRTVTDIRFVEGQSMMLVLPMNRECACEGTTCPSAGDPHCDNINQPVLQPFDPAVAPSGSMSTINGTGGAGGTPVQFDAAAR